MRIPERPQRAPEAQRLLHLVAIDGPAQCGSQIVVVSLQAIQPTDLVVALQSFFGVLREMKIEVAMTSAHHLAVGGIAELLETVLSDGLEQAIARIGTLTIR